MENQDEFEKERQLLARAIDSSIWECLQNAWSHRNDERKANYWFNQANLLEKKFTTKYGKHYSYFTNFRS